MWQLEIRIDPELMALRQRMFHKCNPAGFEQADTVSLAAFVGGARLAVAGSEICAAGSGGSCRCADDGARPGHGTSEPIPHNAPGEQRPAGLQPRPETP